MIEALKARDAIAGTIRRKDIATVLIEHFSATCLFRAFSAHPCGANYPGALPQAFTVRAVGAAIRQDVSFARALLSLRNHEPGLLLH